ncbi:MAG: phytanoyl-CoA dioxygenase family protein [Rhizobiaceae bacterium]
MSAGIRIRPIRGLEPPTITTAWIALTPSTAESGCLKIAPGTHKMEQLPHVDSFAEDNLLSRGQEVAVEVTTLETADIELQPGEMSLHHVRLVDGSEPNRAGWTRLG